MIRPAGAIATAALGAAVMLLSPLGCGSRVICGPGERGLVDRECVARSLRHGETVQVYTRVGEMIRGRYWGVAGAKEDSLLVLSEGSVVARRDTLEIGFQNVERVEVPRHWQPGGVILLIGGLAGFVAFLWVLTSHGPVNT